MRIVALECFNWDIWSHCDIFIWGLVLGHAGNINLLIKLKVPNQLNKNNLSPPLIFFPIKKLFDVLEFEKKSWHYSFVSCPSFRNMNIEISITFLTHHISQPLPRSGVFLHPIHAVILCNNQDSWHTVCRYKHTYIQAPFIIFLEGSYFLYSLCWSITISFYQNIF